MSTTLDLTQITIDQLDQVQTLKELKDWTHDCKACALRAQATQVTFGDGSYTSPIMFTGINPGFCEDGTGIPFTGRDELLRSRCMECTHHEACYSWFKGETNFKQVQACRGFADRIPGSALPKVPNLTTIGSFQVNGIRTAGQVFDDLLIALNIDRNKIFVYNAALCKSTNNSQPKAEEYNSCSRIRLRTQRLLKPKVIVPLGNDPTRQYTGKKVVMKTSHGVPFIYRDTDFSVQVVPTYHPSAILRRMEESSRMSLQEIQSVRAEVLTMKWDMFQDLTVAFNLLSPTELLGIVKDPTKLINGKLPVKTMTV